MTRYKVFWTILIFAGLVWAAIPESSDDEPTRVRMFCAYGRVFVEFEEKYNTWGTTWLDSSGRPVPCDDNTPLRESVSRIDNTI